MENRPIRKFYMLLQTVAKYKKYRFARHAISVVIAIVFVCLGSISLSIILRNGSIPNYKDGTWEIDFSIQN